MRRCAKALARLADRDRQLIVLRVVWGLPCRDVAARLSMRTEAAVHMAVKRALRRLEIRLNQVDSHSKVAPLTMQLSRSHSESHGVVTVRALPAASPVPTWNTPMTLTTTPSIDGKTISSYLGIVTGEAIVGANIFRDLFANIRDIVGGRSAAYEQELARARTIALDELKSSAQQMGADAVVGIDLDYEVLGANNGMLMVSVSGTAVRLT